MKITILTFIFVTAFIVSSRSQEIVGGYSLGYGSYQLRDIKKDQIQAFNNINATYVDVKIMEDFPGWIFQEFYIGYKFGNSEAGGRYNYYTTSGRNYLADYSGCYRNDIFIKGNVLGVYYKVYFIDFPLSETVRFDMNFTITGGLIFNKYISEESLEIYNRPSANKLNTVTYKSVNGFFLPSFTPQVWIKEYIGINLNIGYEIDIQSYLFKNTNGDNIGVNWTGIRISLGVCGKIPLQKK
ncbi:MAG: hypothetical protein LBH92_08350 [Bacteroidales bacterium]|jgi:hypothetical protein|nr:hypothetical protein [Bacteroidales bacterium]